MNRFFRLWPARLLVLCLLAFSHAPAHADTGADTEALTIISGDAKHTFNVEIAATPEKLVKGLMFRNSMPEDAGMLFVFGDMDRRGFWMKNTIIPLDMLFIDNMGKIVDIHEKAVPLDMTSIESRAWAQYVLEINGGTVEKLGIRIGDKAVNEHYFP